MVGNGTCSDAESMDLLATSDFCVVVIFCLVVCKAECQEGIEEELLDEWTRRRNELTHQIV